MKNYRRILITGGTGTLGKAIIETAQKEEWNNEIVILSRDPMRQHLVKDMFPDMRLQFIMGDVADFEAVSFASYGCDLIVHAAAMKHIPEGERDPFSTIESNITGSQMVAQAAILNKVSRVIGISTDKAVHPVNTYGASKYMMEKIFQSYNSLSEDINFNLVRYGNVLGSTGSVLQVWAEMEKNDGHVQATSKDMSRFWLSPAQAVHYISVALTEPGGTITVPILPSLKMEYMANWFLEGITKVTYHGYRPGEKRDEELISMEESFFCQRVEKDKIYRIWPKLENSFSEQGFVYTTETAEKMTLEQFKVLLEESGIKK